MKVLLLVSVILISIAVLLLSIKILLVRGGRFPNTHVGGQKAMQDRGISCHTSQHRQAIERRNLAERLAEQQEL